MRAGWWTVVGRDTAMSTRAMTATGMLTQKMARHVHWVRYPPSRGPMAVSPPATPKNMARALPRSRSGNVWTTTARAAGKRSAPPNPCTARNVTIQASARFPLGVRPHIVDASAKTTTPSTVTLRWPTVSARRPP